MSKADKRAMEKMTILSENKKRRAKKLVAGTALAIGVTASTVLSPVECFADSIYDASDYRGVGYVMKTEEVGPNGNGGTISTGHGDAGGISYGICQYSSKAGTADALVDWMEEKHPEYFKFFEEKGNPKAGTKAFGEAWTNAYNHNNREFENIQMEYALKYIVEPSYEMVKDKFGVDMKSSRSLEEAIISTAVQFGKGGVEDLFEKMEQKSKASGKELSELDNEELIDLLYQEKHNCVGVYKFNSCSSAVQQAAKKRPQREGNELQKIAEEESTPLLSEITGDEEEMSSKEVVQDLAESYMDQGIPYKMGGKSTKALDCSGYVSMMMNDLGIDVDKYNTNALKFRMDSEEISRDELEPGDLVFWHDDKGTRHNSVYHIGVYVGDGLVANCSTDGNEAVTYRNLDDLKDVPGNRHFSFGRYKEFTENIENNTNECVSGEFDAITVVDKEDNIKTNEKFEIIDDIIETGGTIDEDSLIEENLEDEFSTVVEVTPEEVELETPIIEEESETKEDTDDTVEEDTESNETVEEESTEETDSILDNAVMTGDSFIVRVEESVKDHENTEVVAEVGMSAHAYLNYTDAFGEPLINQMPEDSDDIQRVILNLGINGITNPNNADDLKAVINALQEKYPGKEIVVIKAMPVGNEYTTADKDEVNKCVEELNAEIAEYVKDLENVKHIDASEGLVKDGKLDKTDDGLHIAIKDLDTYLENIEKESKVVEEVKEESVQETENTIEEETEVEEDKTEENTIENKEETVDIDKEEIQEEAEETIENAKEVIEDNFSEESIEEAKDFVDQVAEDTGLKKVVEDNAQIVQERIQNNIFYKLGIIK